MPKFLDDIIAGGGSKIGVGVTSPNNALHVSGNLDMRGNTNTEFDTTQIFLNAYNGSSNNNSDTLGTGITWKPYYNTYSKRSAGILQIAEGNYFKSGLAFYTNGTSDATTDWSERMRISMDGKVGIGTASPVKTLTVAGTAQVTGEAFFGNFDNISNNSRMRNDLKLWYNTDRTFGIYGNASKIAIYGNSQDMLTFNTSSNATFAGDVNQAGASHTVSISSGSNIRGTNHLFLQGDGSYVQIKSPNNNVYIDGSAHYFRSGSSTNYAIFTSTNANFSTGVVITGGALQVNNAAADKKISFDRTGGKGISIEHDASSIYFYNETDAAPMFKMYNGGNVQAYGEVEATSLDINGNADISGSLTGLNGSLTTTANYFQLNTPSGYIQIGAMNTSHAHIYTDRPNFYTNKDILVNGATVLTTSTGVQKAGTETITGQKTFSGNTYFTGEVHQTGVNYGLYHGTYEDGYYFDDYNGSRNLSMFLKNQRSDIIRYRQVDNYEYWNGSAWVTDSSQLANVKKLLDGRQDTYWNVPSTHYKFRFTTSASTGWPTRANIGIQTGWSGSTWPGCQMLVEHYESSSWVTHATMEFGGQAGGSATALNSNDNSIDNWGLMFKSDGALHDGEGSSANTTRITIDFYGWTPSNNSYVTIPLQNIFITSNYAGIENTDYTNLLSHDTHIRLGDSRKFIVGAGDDLSIYHNGSNSFIQDTGSGYLALLGSTIKLQTTAEADMLVATPGGAVTLYHSGSSKLATLSDGVDITGKVKGDSLDIDGNADIAGTLSLDDTLTVNGSGVTSQLFLTGTGNGYVNAAVVLQCNDDDGHSRGAGMYMNNVVGATEWFAGRPYSDGDSYKILRRHTTSGNHNNSTADPATTNTTALMDIDSSGNVVFVGEIEGGSLDINGNADISGNTSMSGTLSVGNHLTLTTPAGNSQTGYALKLMKTSSSGTEQVGAELMATAYPANTNGGNLIFKTANSSATATTALTIDGAQHASFVGDVTIAGNLTTEGDLIINNTSNVSIKDTIITLNSGITVSDTRDIGLMFERVGNNKFFGWDESESHFTLAENTQDVSVATTTQLTMGTLQTLRANVHVDTLSVGSENPAQINAIKDEDNMSSDSATSLATQQSIKAYADTKAADNAVVKLTGDQAVAGNKTFSGVTELDGCIVYSMSAGSLDTTGFACAGLSANSNGNGSSALFTFECGGSTGNSYQRIVYTCYNGAGVWYFNKCVDEGGNKFDVVAAASSSNAGNTVTFTFKSRSGTQHYTPRVMVKANGHNIVKTYT